MNDQTDRILHDAANLHFADADDDDYCATCERWLDYGDGRRVDGVMYCPRCANAMEESDE